VTESSFDTGEVTHSNPKNGRVAGSLLLEFSFPLKDKFPHNLLQNLAALGKEADSSDGESNTTILSHDYFGLLVATIIVRSHGGKITFLNSSELNGNDSMGMSVKIQLPLLDMKVSNLAFEEAALEAMVMDK
jgi:hypothetical protein